MTVNWLRILLSPTFVTLKQREPTPGLRQPRFRECLAMSEFVGLTVGLDQAQSIIPKPSYPEATEKKEEFHHRYGWVNEQLSDGGLLRQVPQVRFDDHPGSEGHAKDHHIFGVSFIVLWLCPYDLKRVREHFCQIAAEVMHSPERFSSFRRFQSEKYSNHVAYDSLQRHNEDVAKYLKRDLIDRLCLLEPVEEQEIVEIKCELAKALSVQFTELQCMRSQKQNKDQHITADSSRSKPRR